MAQSSGKTGNLYKPISKIAKTYKSAVFSPITAAKATGKFLSDPTGNRATKRRNEILRKGKRPPSQSYNLSNSVQKKADVMSYAEKSKTKNSPSASTRQRTATVSFVKETQRKGAKRSALTLTPEREKQIKSQYPKNGAKKTNKKYR